MRTEDVLERLAGAAIVKGLNRGELERLCAGAETVSCETGEALLVEGRRSDAFYVILSGRLQVFLPQAGGANRFSDIPLNVLRPGECCGEYALIDEGPASASVVALEPAVLLRLSKQAFEAAVADHDALARKMYCNLLHLLVGRLRAKDLELDLTGDAPECG